MKKNVNTSGFSLVEVMIVITLFGLLAVLITQTLAFSLKGSTKSESLNQVRGDLDNALSVMERYIRNAKSINKGLSDCDEDGVNADTKIYLKDEDDGTDRFVCDTANQKLKWNGNDLVSENTIITACSIDCNVVAEPPSVEIRLVGEDARASGAVGGQVDVQTKINLRSY